MTFDTALLKAFSKIHETLGPEGLATGKDANAQKSLTLCYLHGSGAGPNDTLRLWLANCSMHEELSTDPR